MIFVMTKGGPGRSTQATNFLRLYSNLPELERCLRRLHCRHIVCCCCHHQLLCSTPQSENNLVIDTSASFRVRKAFGLSMMWVLLLFAALPTLWVLILSVREQSAMFEPIWESPLALTLESYIGISRSDFPKALMNSFITAGCATHTCHDSRRACRVCIGQISYIRKILCLPGCC